MTASKHRTPILWLLSAIFFARVYAHAQVALYAPIWLPPMNQWYSGLVPYAVLLPVQMGILMLMAVINADHLRKSGFFFNLGPTVRKWAIGFAAVYFAVMALRLCLHLALYPAGRLLAGTLPIFTHWLFAAYLYLVAMPDRDAS